MRKIRPHKKYNFIKNLKGKLISYIRKVFADEIDKIITTIASRSNRQCVYIGEHKALTKTIFGHKIFVDTRDVSLTPHILLDGYWEMWITNVFKEIIEEGMHVVEIGANIGYYSLITASKIGEKGKAFIFEANPEVFEILHLNMEINGFLNRVELVNKAVMDVQRKVSFHTLKRHYGGSRIIEFSDKFLTQYMDQCETIEIEAISLDEYFKHKKVKIDVIKIDAEGSEPYIFDGMKKLINDNPEILIICEFTPALISGAKRNPKSFLEEIRQYGFNLMFINTDSNIVEASIEDLLNMESCELYLKKNEKDE